jgi:uncharacterized protein YmfQ (DUF2313 family)
MLGRLLPRGPIWQLDTQAELRAFLASLGIEYGRFHQRMIDLLDEADPRTTDELLPEWIAAFGLPAPCGELPTDEDAQRAMLAAKVAAQGGQSRAYFIALAYAALDPSYLESGLEWVTIEERPYGVPFRVSISRVGDPLNGEGAAHYWVLHLPVAESGTPTAEVIECLIGHWKPAHTVVEFEYDTTF